MSWSWISIRTSLLETISPALNTDAIIIFQVQNWRKPWSKISDALQRQLRFRNIASFMYNLLQRIRDWITVVPTHVLNLKCLDDGTCACFLTKYCMMRLYGCQFCFVPLLLVYIFNFLVPFLHLLTLSQIVKESEEDRRYSFYPIFDRSIKIENNYKLFIFIP